MGVDNAIYMCVDKSAQNRVHIRGTKLKGVLNSDSVTLYGPCEHSHTMTYEEVRNLTDWFIKLLPQESPTEKRLRELQATVDALRLANRALAAQLDTNFKSTSC